MAEAIGKRVRGALYVHRSALALLAPSPRDAVEKAASLAEPAQWNVARIEADDIIGLLYYSDFERDAFPALRFAARIDLASGGVKRTDYSASRNPLILHRKEQLVAPDFPGRGAWSALTSRLANLGLFRAPHLIGRRDAWTAMLAAERLDAQGAPL